MGKSPPPRSPIAMVVLALLEERPTHAYRIHELIRERGQDKLVNVAQRNSVYQAITRLLREALIRVDKTSKKEGRPERVTYAITETGSRTLHDWLESNLGTPVREYPVFPAALAFLAVLTPKKVVEQLTERVAALETAIESEATEAKQVMDAGLPRLFLIEDEYRQVMLRAEVDWVKRVIDDIEHERLFWSRELFEALDLSQVAALVQGKK